MSTHSSIEWTESTWNPLTGCTKISPGCKHCYAERMAWRLQAMGQPNYANGFKLTLHEHALEAPLSWKKPQVDLRQLDERSFPSRRVDWNSSSRYSRSCAARHGTRSRCSPNAPSACWNSARRSMWPDNVWMGVSVETQDYTFRIDHLRQTDARIKFLSLEPLLGPLPSPGSARHQLGHRRRRIRARCKTASGRMGAGDSRSMSNRPRSFLLQAMGGRAQEKRWEVVRRSYLGRNAYFRARPDGVSMNSRGVWWSQGKRSTISER